VRAITLLNKQLDMPGVYVTGASFPVADPGVQVVYVALRRLRLHFPLCDYTTRARYDRRSVWSWWRHLAFGRFRVEVRAALRRLECPEHGVLVEGVPFARHRAGFTRDFDDVAAFLATKTDKTTIVRFLRIAWDTVGRICERVVSDGLDTERLDGLVHIGVDEISWKKHHKYLTLVTLNAFFDELGEERASQIEAVSMDMGSAFNKSVRAEGHAPKATICIDQFHAVKLVGEALDVERLERATPVR
jgi:transposase